MFSSRNRKAACYICFPMDTYYKKIFYTGIAYKEYPEKGQKLKRTGLPLKKLGRELPYLLGEGRGTIGKLQIYFSLLPEYAGKTLFGGKPKAWKPEMARKLLRGAGEKAYSCKDCSEQILGMSFEECAQDVPIELLAAWLYQQRPFDSICISVEQEGGEQELWKLAELLKPYLPRMKRVAIRGQRNQLSDVLENYLYDEFGIVMMDTEKIPADMVSVNLGHFENCLKAVKFLDTIVKNGYNTKVD